MDQKYKNGLYIIHSFAPATSDWLSIMLCMLCRQSSCNEYLNPCLVGNSSIQCKHKILSHYIINWCQKQNIHGTREMLWSTQWCDAIRNVGQRSSHFMSPRITSSSLNQCQYSTQTKKEMGVFVPNCLYGIIHCHFFAWKIDGWQTTLYAAIFYLNINQPVSILHFEL